jgi:Rad4 beta-hairpin domain 3
MIVAFRKLASSLNVACGRALFEFKFKRQVDSHQKIPKFRYVLVCKATKYAKRAS